ncbi:MAG TPA: DUF167 domain-containing protein [Gemmatimonadales bacterium]|nr:DUF167 domain-containing protein [Gemmatimonadales bacterium]
MTWMVETSGGVRLRVHVQPRATRTEVAGLHGNAVKIRLAAPPVDGAANAALIEFLAQQLDLPRRAIELISGQASRAKTVEIRGLTGDALRQRLRL